MRVRLSFHGPALVPGIDALAGLAAQLPERDLVEQHLRRLRLAARSFLRQLLAGGEADVQPYRIGELDRAHRHAEGLHRRVDGLGLDALVQHAEGVLHVGAEHAVDEEPRRVFHRQRQLVDLANERKSAFYMGGIRLRGVHHLNQHHLRNRVEEMNPDQA